MWVLWIPVLNMEFQPSVTHLILFTTVHYVVLWVIIPFLRGTHCLHIHPSSWIRRWQIPLKLWYPAITNLDGLLTQKTTLTAVITYHIYIQFLTITVGTSGSILSHKLRWRISDMCMVLFLCHNYSYVLHVSNNRIVLLVCHDCVLHMYQTVV